MNEVDRLLDELVKVKLIGEDLLPPYKIQFEGNFELESFASHGIILIGEKIFSVCCTCSLAPSLLFVVFY
jgi:hypothetical protein